MTWEILRKVESRDVMPYKIIHIYPTMHKLIHFKFGVADFFGTGGGDPPISFGRGGIGWKDKEEHSHMLL